MWYFFSKDKKAPRERIPTKNISDITLPISLAEYFFLKKKAFREFVCGSRYIDYCTSDILKVKALVMVN
jgi:hypothetical protein